MGRFFAAIGRFFNFLFLRRSEDIRKAADAQFTNNPAGISAGYAIERDKVASDFRDLQQAVGKVLNILEQRKLEVINLTKEEDELKVKAQGALTRAEQEDAAGRKDGPVYLAAKAAFDRYHERMQEIDARQAALTEEVSHDEKAMQAHMAKLTALKSRLERLPKEEAEMIADFVSSRQITELNNQMMNAGDSLRDSPVAAIRAKVQEMSAQARVTEKLVGTDSRVQDDEFARLGRETKSGDTFEAILAARRTQREGTGTPTTTDKPVKEGTATERPKI